MKSMYQAGMLLALMTVLCGVIYPLFVTAVGQLFFSEQSNGSLLRRGETIVGSKLIGQRFKDQKYFWSRPSASDYNTMPSGASNLGPTSRDLASKIQDRKEQFALAHGVEKNTIPTDLLTASASGLDPHISLDAATMQVARIAHARGLDQAKLRTLVHSLIEGNKFALFGETRVNVVMLNLSLDENF
jgi:potassium-transporting ATPase KdpC subunit